MWRLKNHSHKLFGMRISRLTFFYFLIHYCFLERKLFFKRNYLCVFVYSILIQGFEILNIGDAIRDW